MSAPIVAAILTIVGFSINNTIVIFDRIREDLKLGLRGTFADIINHALNQTLSRTIVTSGTTLLSTLALYLFGGGVVNDVAKALGMTITKTGATAEQKAELIKGATELLQRVLNKNPATTVVVIDEVETDNWGVGGESVTARNAKAR